MLFHVSAALLALGLIGSTAAAPEVQGPPAVCNADNCLRALRATKRAAEATPFCEAYIPLPTTTVTDSTVYPVTTITSDVVAEATNINWITEYHTVTHSPVVTETTTVTVKVRIPGKRSEVPIPSFMQSYPASRISSACYCLGLPTPAVTVTPTAATATFVTTVTSTVTVNTDVITTLTTDFTISETSGPSTTTETITVWETLTL